MGPICLPSTAGQPCGEAVVECLLDEECGAGSCVEGICVEARPLEGGGRIEPPPLDDTGVPEGTSSLEIGEDEGGCSNASSSGSTKLFFPLLALAMGLIAVRQKPVMARLSCLDRR